MTEHAYIHIPFCIRKCKYCSFVSGEDIERKEQYLEALFKEIKVKYKSELLKTLYFGGGTPSLLSFEDINKIISLFNLSHDCEITLEANPETVKENIFKKYNVNRISLGVQSFNDNILKIIGRNHSEKTIYKAVEIIKKSGFKNISIDLIYGLPFQTKEIFKSDIEKALELNINHISSYGLKIEKGSFFYKNPPSTLPDEEMQADLFLFMSKKLKENGFNHYEISNFAKESFESRHNLCYWKNKNYYGFGLNASAYVGNIRSKNQSLMNEYVKDPTKLEENIILTPAQIMEDEIFLALRLKDGIDISKFNKKFNINFIEKYKNILIKYKDYLILKDNKFSLNENGMLISNEIMSEFIN